jgi:hypothetical protein
VLCAVVAAVYVDELRRREKELGVEPDTEVDAFLKAEAVEGKRTNIVTDLILRVLGLQVRGCLVLTAVVEVMLGMHPYGQYRSYKSHDRIKGCNCRHERLDHNCCCFCAGHMPACRYVLTPLWATRCCAACLAASASASQQER